MDEPQKTSAGFAGLCSVVLAVALSGCLFEGSKAKAVKVKVEILRVESPAVARKSAVPSDPAAAPAWSSDLSITTFKVPLHRLSLHNAAFTRSAELYTCAGSGVECQLEAAGEALQNELDAPPVTVPPGEYRYVSVKSCADGAAEASAALTATVVLDGRAWHTHPTAILDSVGPARPVFLKTRACGRTYALPNPLRIPSSGEDIVLKLYFDLAELAHAALGSRQTAKAWSADNCAGPRPAEADVPGPPFVCIGYPELSGLTDAAPPALERYRINGGGTLGLFFAGGSDLPAGGYTRRYYREGATLDPGFDAGTPLRDLTRNADGTLSMAAFGSGELGQSGSAFQVASFRRATHGGSFTGLPDSLGTPSTGSYSAVRLTP